MISILEIRCKNFIQAVALVVWSSVHCFDTNRLKARQFMYFIDHLLNICKDATALTFFLFDLYLIRIGPFSRADINFRAEKRSAQASAHPLSQAQCELFCDCVRQFVCLSLREFWLRLNEMHKVWTCAPRKAFLLLCGFCFSSLENYFGLGTTNVKGKTDHSFSLR